LGKKDLPWHLAYSFRECHLSIYGAGDGGLVIGREVVDGRRARCNSYIFENAFCA
jgi:hypothetical protein